MLTPSSHGQRLLLHHVLQSSWEPWYFGRTTKPILLGMLVLLPGTQFVGLIHHLWILTYPTASSLACYLSALPPQECP